MLPGIVHVKNNLVDDVLWTDKTLDVFENVLSGTLKYKKIHK